jgi:beta-glucosidase
MSLSWSRILPNGTTDGGINGKGVAFYNYVINELIAAGITPWVTLHHWDTPSAVHNKTSTGSFLSKDIIDKFNNYADFVFAAYGDRVKHWLTLNEPWTYSVNGYLSGEMAPGRCSDLVPSCVTNGGGGDLATEPYIVSHNMILSHAKAVQTYRQKYQAKQGGVISLTTNTDFAVPYNISSPLDVSASSRQLAFAFGWYFDPIVFGKYPDEMTQLITDGRLPTFTPEETAMVKGSFDFIGLNHYTTSYIKDKTGSWGGDWFADSRTDGTKIGIDGKPIGPMAQSDWLYVYPPGMRGILKWIDQRYNGSKIYVFENGVSVPGEN